MRSGKITVTNCRDAFEELLRNPDLGPSGREIQSVEGVIDSAADLDAGLIRSLVQSSRLIPTVRKKFLGRAGTVAKLLRILEADTSAPGLTPWERVRLRQLKSRLGHSSRFATGPRRARVLSAARPEGEGSCERSSPSGRTTGRALGPAEALQRALLDATSKKRNLREQTKILSRAIKRLREEITRAEQQLTRPRGRPSEIFDHELWDTIHFAFSEAYIHSPKSPIQPNPRPVLTMRRVFWQIIYAFVHRSRGEPELGDPMRAVVRNEVKEILRLVEPCLYVFGVSTSKAALSDDPRVQDYVFHARSSTALGPREATSYFMAKWYQLNRETVVRAMRKRPDRSVQVGANTARGQSLQSFKEDADSRPFPLSEELEGVFDRLGWARIF